MDKDVVDFVPNFDETEKEPSVLPVKVPNLLINGAEGIAVGMATSIPPHNLSEVIEGVKAYMKDPDITTEGMMAYIKGPDFPTGGIVVNKDDLLQIYETGAGKVKVRGRVEVEQAKGGRQRLVITEIPYTMLGANIGKFLLDVYNLAESRKTNDIVDISNQSSKEGIRIVLDLKKGADVENLCNMLYKKTRLEDTFGVNMLAVADGRPETMGLVPVIRHHVDFQYELATRKYKTLLAKELEKKEVQEGLIKACDVIDLIIEILRGAKNIRDAKECLMYGKTEKIKFRFKGSEADARSLCFTERQATAILEMRLYKLIGLEIEALRKEHGATLANIARYEEVLGSRTAMAKAIMKELDYFQKEYGQERKTGIENAKEAVYEEKKAEEMPVVLLMDRFGYVKAVDVPTYERNKEAADGENRYVIPCMNTDRLCVFTDKGQLHMVKILDIPHGKFRDKGTPLDNISNYDSSGESILYMGCLAGLAGKRLLFANSSGMLKQVRGEEFDVSKRTTAATKLNGGERLLLVHKMEGEEWESIVLQTEKGMFLRFPAAEVPEKKKGAVGVRGMKVDPKDSLKAAYVLGQEESYVTVREKEVALHRLRMAGRDGKGVKKA